MNDLISRREAIDALMARDKELRNINWYDKPYAEGECRGIDEALAIVNNISSAQPEKRTEERAKTHACDLINRQDAIDAFGLSEKTRKYGGDHSGYDTRMLYEIQDVLEGLPPAQPERKWTSCSNPPKHHKDVIVRGIEAIGNVTVHKVMQWDVDTWRPTDYAPSVMWKEWSEI